MNTLAAHPATSKKSPRFSDGFTTYKDNTRYLRHAIGARRLMGGAFLGSELTVLAGVVGCGDEEVSSISGSGTMVITELGKTGGRLVSWVGRI